MSHTPALPLPDSLPRWLRPVMVADRTLSAWFVGCGFGFAPLLPALSHAPWATALAVTASVALLLTWDVLGVRSGVFFRGQTDFMTGLLVAPEIPLEEVVFLAFLSHLALVCATGAVTFVEHVRSRRAGERA